MPGLGALSRTSPILSLIILISFGITFLSTAYNLAAFSPREFIQRPEVSEYENQLVEVSAMDKWSRTQLYWSHNLKVAGYFAVFSPTYFAFISNTINSYAMGVAIVYHNATEGWRAALAFSAQIFVHGILELTGIFIITAASFRLAWKFWGGMGYLSKLSLGKQTSRNAWREIIRRRKEIELEIFDFLVLLAVGSFMIFLAGPIESYISPIAGAVFLSEPLTAVLFLFAVGLFYFWLAKLGFGQMLRNLHSVRENIACGFRGEFKLSQVPILTFIVLLSASFLGIILS